MKRLNLWLVLLTTFAGCTPSENSNVDLTQYVNPMIGTDFTGNTYPGAQLPFGMVQLSPDNGLPGWDRISGYFYPDSTFILCLCMLMKRQRRLLSGMICPTIIFPIIILMWNLWLPFASGWWGLLWCKKNPEKLFVVQSTVMQMEVLDVVFIL